MTAAPELNKLVNPTVKDVPATSGYGNCFGCSPKNHRGIAMEFAVKPGANLIVTSQVKLGAEFESFPGMVHGGIIATILDEIMAQAALRAGRCPATTAGMRVRYAQVMETDKLYFAVAEAGTREGDLIRVSGRLETLDGKLVAVADGTFLLWTEQRAEEATLTLPKPALQSLKKFFRDLEVTP